VVEVAGVEVLKCGEIAASRCREKPISQHHDLDKKLHTALFEPLTKIAVKTCQGALT
jgi:hypothetical protein